MRLLLEVEQPAGEYESGVFHVNYLRRRRGVGFGARTVRNEYFYPKVSAGDVLYQILYGRYGSGEHRLRCVFLTVTNF